MKSIEIDCVRCCTSARSYSLIQEAQKEIKDCNLTYRQSDQMVLMASSHWQIYGTVK